MRMWLAPSRLRLRNLIFSPSSSTYCTPLTASYVYPSCRRRRLHTAASSPLFRHSELSASKGSRRNPTVCSVLRSSFHQSARDQRLAGDDDAYSPEPPPSGAAASSSSTNASPSSSSTYLSHLKRRGHFLPAPIDNDESDILFSQSQQPNGRAVLSAHHYGKWRELLFDYDRLLFETGFQPASTLMGDTRQRAVDRPEHAGDIGLWSAIFNFAYRRREQGGALQVWREVFQRRQLYKTDGLVARAFWQAVLESAVEDEAFLESTWAYAEWMRDEHDAYWPHYYRTVVTGCLNNGEYGRALRWHVRLSPHFGISRRDFFDMLKDFLTDPDPALQETLQDMYATSPHRMLYDTIVPLLWSQGLSALAQGWREVLIRHNDRPSSGASRPFLQYLAGYYPETELSLQENTVANGQPAKRDTAALSPKESEGKQAKAPGLPTNLYYLLNRVHGETFGIQEKPFNDKIGAKWFATNWVTLDMAFSLVYGLGVSEIGPLSLQSIALREGSPEGLLHRLEQLHQYRIGTGKSNYARAVRYFAKTGDAETLDELLHSTLHPDVFDDAMMQRYMIGSARFTGDWTTHRLILAVRLAVSEDALVATANRLVSACLEQHANKKKAILKLLDELAARSIELYPSTAQAVSDLAVHEVPRKFMPQDVPDVDFYIALCRRLAALNQPVATEAWQNILFLLGRQGRLKDFERVTLDVVNRYVDLQTAGPPHVRSKTDDLFTSFVASLSPQPPPPHANMAFKVHVSDVPSVVRGEDAEQPSELGYRLLPRDLPLDHPLHPLSLIFTDELTRSIVRWYFHRKMAYRQGQNAARPQTTKTASGKEKRGAKKSIKAFSMAGGIRLLGMLRDRGVAVSREIVRSEALVCIAAVFGPESMATRYWHPARSMNQLKVGEVKELCDAAWAEGGHRDGNKDSEGGSEEPLLPSVEVLEKALEGMQPAAESFGRQFTRRGEKKTMSREVFLDAISKESGPGR